MKCMNANESGALKGKTVQGRVMRSIVRDEVT